MNSPKPTRLTSLLLALVCQPILAYDHVQVERADRGMVVSESVAASRIGRDVLRNGGTAVDAAVATAFALAVAWPEAGNIGGGGFMMIRPHDERRPECIDYRETAPAEIDRAAFSVRKSSYTHRSVGVPGTIRGLAMAHDKYGIIPWKRLVEPAADLAEQGVAVDRFLARSINLVLQKTRADSQDAYAELHRVYGKPSGGPWSPGDRMKLPDLAKTLRAIAANGPAEFYNGSTAKQISDEMSRGGGLIADRDLSGYQAISREVVSGSYRGYTILGAPPASSGGTCVIQALNILENFDLAKRDPYDPTTIHLIAEASRRAFATRARYLGDPEFKSIPDFLVSKKHAKMLASTIDLESATSNRELVDLTGASAFPSESPDTTHFSIIDADGMVVSNTYTIRHPWGSRIVVRGTGIVLNNLFGGHQWIPKSVGGSDQPAPSIEAGRRLLSSQAPTIVEKDGKLVLVTGSPGGRSIISTVIGILVNLIDFQMSPAEAVEAPRMHHQWKPDRIDLERIVFEPHIDVPERLESMGHRVRGVPPQGSAHTIAIDLETNEMIGIADYRRGGTPVGVDSREIARWEFSERAGVGIAETKFTGNLSSGWSAGLPMTTTNGLDCLRIRHQPSRPPPAASFQLPEWEKDSRPLEISAKIDAALFVSQYRGERCKVGLVDDADEPGLGVQMVLRPSDEGIMLYGEALGSGEKTEPIPICDGNRLDQPVVLFLRIDATSNTYTVGYRLASRRSTSGERTTTISSNRSADFVRLAVEKHVDGRDEWVDVDWIAVRRTQ